MAVFFRCVTSSALLSISKLISGVWMGMAILELILELRKRGLYDEIGGGLELQN